jgi:hypothetical protein
MRRMERVFCVIVAFALGTMAVVSPASAVQAQLGQYGAGAHCRESPYEVGRKLVGRPVTDIFAFTPTAARAAGWLYAFRAHDSVIQLGDASRRDEVANALTDVGDTTAAGLVATDRGMGFLMSSWPLQPKQIRQLIAHGALSPCFTGWEGRLDAPPAWCMSPRLYATVVSPKEPIEAPESVRELSGRVSVTVSLDAQSRVTSVEGLPASGGPLQSAALAIARRSTYRTDIRDCVPVASKYTLQVRFVAGKPVRLWDGSER